ncbi:MAG: IS1182 family transposase [Nitrospirae bacterium]|nr:IS1182 family transposase [Nitrospirota bacterium]
MPLRPYDQDQIFLLPPSLNEWVRDDHPARVLSEITERLDTTLFRETKIEGRPAYHPLMMLKILLWGYASGIRSSRKIATKLQTDVAFMWLAALEKPDFRTICLFRTANKNMIEKVFAEVVLMARAMGMGKLGLIALDGTKIQANAGVESFKKVEDWREALKEAKEEIRRILSEAEETDKKEDSVYGADSRGDELSEGLRESADRVEKIEKLLKEAKRLGKDEKSRMSLTDAEASFMHRKAGSIPAYNAQAAVTEDQLIVYADVTTEPIDVNQLKPAIEGIEGLLQQRPEKVVADAGYTGGENLEALEIKDIDGYIPESGEKNIGKIISHRPEQFQKDAFRYDKNENLYICPSGEEMQPVANSTIKTKYSEKHKTTYRTARGVCSACEINHKCTTNKKMGRAITRDGYDEYRQRMREKIKTKEGREIYGKRKILAEPVFGQMRVVGGLTQFLLRGLEKVGIEWKIGAIAHNLLKIIRRVLEGKVVLAEMSSA